MYDDDSFDIDDTAKLIVPMSRVIDRDGNPYFIGKLQFPGTVDFIIGVSIMLFTSEENAEELQIGVLDPNKRSGKSRSTRGGENRLKPDGRIRIDLHPIKDSHGNTYYIGEAIAPFIIPCRKPGIFFSAFTAQTDKEELQISMLKHKKRFDKREASRPMNERPQELGHDDDDDDDEFEQTA